MSYVDGLNSFNEHDEKLAMSHSGSSCGEKWSAWPTYPRNGRYESKADKPNL